VQKRDEPWGLIVIVQITTDDNLLQMIIQTLAEIIPRIIGQPAFFNALQVPPAGGNGDAVIPTGQNLALQGFKKLGGGLYRVFHLAFENEHPFDSLELGISGVAALHGTPLSVLGRDFLSWHMSSANTNSRESRGVVIRCETGHTDSNDF
jgi:hypothetical protein